MTDRTEATFDPAQLRFLRSSIRNYGGRPVEWHIRAVYRNRLLEESVAHSQFDFGQRVFEVEARWKERTDLEQIILDKPEASRVCTECGGDTLDGAASLGNRIFCVKEVCQAKIAPYQDEIRAQMAARKAEGERSLQEYREKGLRELEEARTGFHCEDGWHFQRLDGGMVRIAYAPIGASSPTWVTVPPTVWASIVCSVSLDGETAERWNEAQDFHGRHRGGAVEARRIDRRT
jgi:hypothetical protein